MAFIEVVGICVGSATVEERLVTYGWCELVHSAKNGVTCIVEVVNTSIKRLERTPLVVPSGCGQSRQTAKEMTCHIATGIDCLRAAG
jgi:hypothetical protein